MKDEGEVQVHNMPPSLPSGKFRLGLSSSLCLDQGKSFDLRWAVSNGN